jgi:hypothetical protein
MGVQRTLRFCLQPVRRRTVRAERSGNDYSPHAANSASALAGSSLTGLVRRLGDNG